MAITATTLAAAVGRDDLSITVASATGALTKNVVQIDGEFLVQTTDALNTVIPVRRGDQGTFNETHNAGAVVLMGLASDFPPAPPGSITPIPVAPNWTVASYAAAGAIAVPTTKRNVFVKLSAGSAAAMTLADPTYAQEGQEMLIQAEAAQAYTVAGTFNAGGSGADLATFGGAVGDTLHVKAVSQQWHVLNLNGVTIG